MIGNLQIFGGIAALVSAVAWGFASILWRKIGDDLSPLGMNFVKSVIGCLYLGVVLFFTGIETISSADFWILSLSGILGVALSDTFFFISLMHLGPRVSVLFGALLPVSITFAAIVFLGERPSFLIWNGIFLTIGGIAWVLWERTTKKKIVANKALGICYGLLSIITMTIGIILAKIGVKEVSPLQATFIRLFFGGVGLVVWGIVRHQLRDWIEPLKNPILLKRLLLVVFIGTFGGFWLSHVSLKYIDVSVASTLNSTTPLFILPMVAIILKEKISIRAILGSGVVVVGVALIFLGE